jgi:hypothetical protein
MIIGSTTIMITLRRMTTGKAHRMKSGPSVGRPKTSGLFSINLFKSQAKTKSWR